MLSGHKSSKYISPCSSIETLWQNGFSFIYSCWFNYMKRIFNHDNQECYIKLWGALFYGLLGHPYDCFPTCSNCIIVTVYVVEDILGLVK